MSTDTITSSVGLLEGYAALLQLMGHRVVRTCDSLWFDVRRAIYQPAFAWHQDPRQAHEAGDVRRRTHALACRWFGPAENRSRKTGGGGVAVFVAQPPFELSRLDPKARNQTRRGLERVQVRPCRFTDEIEAQALPVYADNVRRLGLFHNEAALSKKWRQWVGALRASPVLEFWGGWQEKTLIAFAVTAKTPWGLEIICQRSLSAGLGFYPNNALAFLILEQAFQKGEPLVSYGLSEFGAQKAGLDHFKKGMGFNEVPLDERFVWSPLLRPFSKILAPQHLRRLARLVKRFGTIRAE